jgi:hypothetical protein
VSVKQLALVLHGRQVYIGEAVKRRMKAEASVPSICNSSMRGVSAQVSRWLRWEAARLWYKRRGPGIMQLLDAWLGVKRVKGSQDSGEKRDQD